VLEHHEQLIVELRQEVRAALLAAHRHRDAREVGLLLLRQPRILHLHTEAGVALAFVVLDDDREVHATQLHSAKRGCLRSIDGEEGHAIFFIGAS
jgi:hypothetical protein